MKTALIAILAALAATAPALAADNSRSPYDTNPACLDRKVDSSKGDCLIMDTGSPRQKYPPKSGGLVGTPATPATPVAPAAPAAREAAPPAGRKGG